ncbi:restriction endonuclease subunit S [Psychroflexus sp. ALD_RP9]|uniref:restriction endonuclease subunit S n=1 Tax=Psychroflexus sp. ALD_RP9 TaxID=2777186 RepID=UPI001A8D3272|nr:restriction endonuclease subunit S [Psychroflexus sp. ALD_RP9]QSS96337.1 restriction endonuclease subunit S [Psychroflexus sp. ALD_RP9]
MEGLEISEVLYSEMLGHSISTRIDAEFFKKEYLIEDDIIENYGSKKLVSITDKIDVGFVGSMTSHYRESGIVLIQTKNISSFLLDLNSTIKITEDFHKSLQKSQINYQDILIARSGSFGKASIYLETETINSSDIIIIKANETFINPYFLTAFLNSIYGVNQMIRFASGGLQGHVNLTILEELKVPTLSEIFQESIGLLISTSYDCQKKSKRKYKQAESLLLNEIGLQNFTPSSEGINVKTLSNSFWETGRLDAEYYQPKYEEYENLIKKSKFSYIRDEYIHITKKSKKEKEGYNYIEIGDVNVGDGSNVSNYRLTEDLPANAKIAVKKGDILISKVRPYRGAVTIINSDLDDLIVSGAFTVLRSNPKSIYNNEVLKVLLRTEIYKDWLLQFNVGTSYPVIKDDDVLNMPIPHISEAKQNDIAKLIEESFALKKQSEHLLEVAKRAVEIAIEEGEEEALQYINQNS